MPITFGSVSDIISVSSIIKNIVQALGESRGSAAEYQEIIRELSTLDRVFLEVEQLSSIKERSIELNVLYTTADDIIDACRKCLHNFLEKCQKYDASLGEGKKENLFRDVSRKIQWRLVERQELDRFRRDIDTHSSCLNILLITLNVAISNTGYRRFEERQAAAEDRAQADLLAQNTMLGHIQDRLQENTQLVASISSNAASIARLLKLGWLKRMGLAVKEHLADIISVNMSIYQTVIRIQAAIPYISQGPITDIFILEDAIGRTTPVTLQFINSWDAFDSVLETRFRNLPGHLKILRKEFVLQERATMRDISRVGPWEGAILPGQKIDMSMVFTDTRSETRIPCPGCSHTCDNYSDAGTQCINCGISFSRIIDLSDSDDGQPASQGTKVRNSHSSQTKDTHSRGSNFGKPASSTREFGPSRLPVVHGGQPSWGTGVQPKDEIFRYKRVIIICRRRLGRNQTFGSSAFATAGRKADSENCMDLDSFQEKERALGARHPETILAMVMLAKNYQIQNRFKAAEKLLRGALYRDEGFLQSRPDVLETACRVLIAISIDASCLNETNDVCQQFIELAKLQTDNPEFAGYQTQLRDILRLQEIQKAANINGTRHDADGDGEPAATDYIVGHSLTSLSVNVSDYNFENGRRYHNSELAIYHLPNDDREQERLDLQYEAIVLLVDKFLFLSPIKNPKTILDQGTGTGVWAIDVGDAYPAAQVYGIDISPIQPSFVPPNVQFIYDDMELSWLYDENSLDLVHSCMGNAFSSRDWDHFLTESQAQLAPGGWVEIKDIDFTPMSEDFSLPQDSCIMRWHELLEKASLAGNVNFRFDAARLAGRLQNLGFINITIKTFRIPLGRQQGDLKSKTTSAWWREVLKSSLEPYSMALFTRFLGWSALEVVRFLVDVRVEMSNVAYNWDWQL